MGMGRKVRMENKTRSSLRSFRKWKEEERGRSGRGRQMRKRSVYIPIQGF